MGTVFKLFAVSPPGLEYITARELKELGIEGKVVKGGVEFKGTLKDIYRTNLLLRTANRILVRVAIFKAKSFKELVERVKRYPWEIYIQKDLPIKLRVTSRKSKLYHTKAIEERIVRGIMERVKFEPLITEEEDLGESIIVRVERNRFTISVNSSGAMLHKRGYRRETGDAPLREIFAAAMVLESGWKGDAPLIDPFCGSGTIPIEAALICTNTPPGLYREFAFEKWRIHSEELWQSVKEEAAQSIKECRVPIMGFDKDRRSVKAAQINAFFSRVKANLSFEVKSLPKLSMEKAYIVTNPPYGIRVEADNLTEIYASFGRWVKSNFKEAHVVILSPLKRYVEATGLRLERVTSFSNGGIRVGLYRGTTP